MSNKKMNLLDSFMAMLAIADVVIIDEIPVLSWATSPVSGKPENQVVHFNWDACNSDGEKFDFSLILTEEGILAGKFNSEKKTFVIEDHEGDKVELSVCTYAPMALLGAGQ